MEYIDFDSQFWLDINDRRNIWHYDYFACKIFSDFYKVLQQ